MLQSGDGLVGGDGVLDPAVLAQDGEASHEHRTVDDEGSA